MAMIMASRKDMNLVSHTPPMMMAADRRLVGGFSLAATTLRPLRSAVCCACGIAQSRTHLTVGLQQALADADASDTVLTPMGTQAVMRLPYAMQIGDEALD